MSQAEASAWWDDVQHLREAAERREATASSRRHLSVAGDEDFADAGEDAPSAAPRAERPACRARDEERAPGAPRAERPARREVRVEDSVQTRRLRAAEPRRTVQITGRIEAPVVPGPGTDRDRGRRRTAVSAANIGARPDRIALWAVVLGLFLVVVAAISSDSASAATLLTSGV